jgi:hypothetical protein
MLYVYTDRAGLQELLHRDRLDPTSLRRGGRDVHLRQPLTWLTDNMSPDAPVARAIAGLPDSQRPDTRVTVVVADAQRWPVWAKRHWINPAARRRVEVICGGQGAWLWVLPRAIRSEEWARAEDLRTGDVLPFDR